MEGNSQGTTTEGVAYTRDDAVDAFLKTWTKDATEPSESNVDADATEATEETEETTEVEETPEDSDEASGEEEESTEESDDSEDPPEKDPAYATDDAKVKLSVDGEEMEVSVKDLKRLYGQEAALTKKSQEVAETRKNLTQTQEYVESTLELALAQAEERIKPYQEIDWVVASKRLNEEELVALRRDAQKAVDEYKVITERVTEYQAKKNEVHQAELQKVIQTTHEALSKPPAEGGIPNWGKETYQDLVDYAKGLGFPQHAIDTFVTPQVWQLLHKARQFDKGKTVATNKINKTPKNVVKATKTPPTRQQAQNTRAQEALKKLRDSGGDRESATNAFLARWSA